MRTGGTRARNLVPVELSAVAASSRSRSGSGRDRPAIRPGDRAGGRDGRLYALEPDAASWSCCRPCGRSCCSAAGVPGLRRGLRGLCPGAVRIATGRCGCRTDAIDPRWEAETTVPARAGRRRWRRERDGRRIEERNMAVPKRRTSKQRKRKRRGQDVAADRAPDVPAVRRSAEASPCLPELRSLRGSRGGPDRGVLTRPSRVARAFPGRRGPRPPPEGGAAVFLRAGARPFGPARGLEVREATGSHDARPGLAVRRHGSDLAAADARAKEMFERADEVLGIPLSGSAGRAGRRAHEDQNAQPAILTHSVVVWSLLPDPSGGADRRGAFSRRVQRPRRAGPEFDDALRLVRRRGELMAAPETRGPGRWRP